MKLMCMDTIPSWVDDVFAELNTKFFGSKLRSPKYTLAPFDGQLAASTVYNGISGIFFHPRILDRGRAFVADTLLHELVHLELIRRGEQPDKDHGVQFVALANQIGRKLGLPDVQPCSDAASLWPQSVRLRSYYHDWR
jgi:predicted SprT family Zn-dependent metalloprotease